MGAKDRAIHHHGSALWAIHKYLLSKLMKNRQNTLLQIIGNRIGKRKEIYQSSV